MSVPPAVAAEVRTILAPAFRVMLHAPIAEAVEAAYTPTSGKSREQYATEIRARRAGLATGRTAA